MAIKNNKIQNIELENQESLSQIWKNKYFQSLIPIGVFNQGGLYAIQTLWAGPWLLMFQVILHLKVQQDFLD